jgi:hypothetical protein
MASCMIQWGERRRASARSWIRFFNSSSIFTGVAIEKLAMMKM